MSKEIEQQLREAILKSGLSYNAIMNRCGVSAGIICRFVKHERTMTMASASKIAKLLGLVLTKVK
ncbi:MAG: hypothetical protein WC975_06575 [Phycisphaerae bacterium]